MKALLVALTLMLTVVAAPPAFARPVLLAELFASKNCRSCPAAYANLTELQAGRDDLLVLTWPVDYWDYLGERDTMALPQSRDRQRGYVERFRLRGPYTPQVVIDGQLQVPGNRPGRLASAVSEAVGNPVSGINIAQAPGGLTLEGSPGSLTDLWWVTYLAGDDNTSAMPNPVTSVRQIGPWLGGRANITLPGCDSGCVLIVQEAGFGRILAIEPGL